MQTSQDKGEVLHKTTLFQTLARCLREGWVSSRPHTILTNWLQVGRCPRFPSCDLQSQEGAITTLLERIHNGEIWERTQSSHARSLWCRGTHSLSTSRCLPANMRHSPLVSKVFIEASSMGIIGWNIGHIICNPLFTPRSSKAESPNAEAISGPIGVTS